MNTNDGFFCAQQLYLRWKAECGGAKSELLDSYLTNKWYWKFCWRLWSRRDPAEVPLSRTEMNVESHGSVSKLSFLLQVNRPLVDLLVHSIATKFLPKLRTVYKAFQLWIKKPFWWRAFTKTWKLWASLHASGTEYVPDQSNLLVAAQVGNRTSFFVQNLIGNKNCSQYHHVTIQR